eukprot:1180447-Amphidinium_carterae.1
MRGTSIVVHCSNYVRAAGALAQFFSSGIRHEPALVVVLTDAPVGGAVKDLQGQPCCRSCNTGRVGSGYTGSKSGAGCVGVIE